MAAGIPLRRTRDILLEAALPVAASVYILLVAHNFLGAYVSFLTLLAKVLAPWAAVFGVDTLRHLRRDYRLQELYRGAQSDYGKLRLQELAAWLVGIAAALLNLVGAASASRPLRGGHLPRLKLRALSRLPCQTAHLPAVQPRRLAPPQAKPIAPAAFLAT
jgi:purine-cytosine permease-like protein